MVDAYEFHFFFIDIVGLSEPRLSTEEQINKINILNQYIRECHAFNEIPLDKLKILPTGDGAVIGFPEKVNLPLDLAIELHRKLRKYNENKTTKEQIKTRIGIHTAPVMNVQDLRNDNNIWGDGIIIARRIMDAGQADHILLSSQVGEKLANLSKDYEKILYHAGLATFKHGRQEFLWYAYGVDFGNNSTSEIEGLNVQEKDATFSAEILNKKIFHRGETIFTKVYFKGTLHGGFFDNMFRSPEGKTFPGGGSDWWCFDHATHSGKEGSGELVGDIDKTSTWGCTIPENFPTGEYTVYIRVYDHLPNGQRPVIREKVETIKVIDELWKSSESTELQEKSVNYPPERGIDLPADSIFLRWILKNGRKFVEKTHGHLNASLNKEINILKGIAGCLCVPFFSISLWFLVTRTFDPAFVPTMIALGFLMLGIGPCIYLIDLIKKRRCPSCESNFTLEKIKSTLLEEKQIGSKLRRIEDNTYRCTFCNNVSSKREARYSNTHD